MSKIVFICFRNREQDPYTQRDVEVLSESLTPDNIVPSPPLLIKNSGIFAVLFNPVKSLPVKNSSVCMGNLIEPADDWWKPGAEVPDGSYALFRSDENRVEVLTDIVASRTIWYVRTEDMFIASTSQRAIVFFLQDFQPNKITFSWVLSSGTLGPGLSWDNRIKHLSGNSRLCLDRSSWEMTVKKEEIGFEPLNVSEKEHEARLRKVLEQTYENLNLDYSKWYLALSGGFDSRASLLMLKNKKDLKCVTWGLKASLDDENNDAYLARALAKHFNLEHKYLATNISDEPVEKIFNRFLVAGEGRTVDVAAYMDGLKVWKILFEDGIYGIIRGDHGQGDPVKCLLFFNPRKHCGAKMLSDYSNLKNIEEDYFGKQVWPENLRRKKKEPLATWYIRLYQDYHMPFKLAALTDLKCAYVEIVNPLASGLVTTQIRKMPNNLRLNKVLFSKIVSSTSPEIKFFSGTNANILPENLLKAKQMVKLIRDELDTVYARGLLSDTLVHYILCNIKVSQDALSTKNKKRGKSLVAHFVPEAVKNILRNTVIKERMDCNVLAFRAYIICKMNQLLTADALALKQGRRLLDDA